MTRIFAYSWAPSSPAGLETISAILNEFPDAKIIAISGGGRTGDLNALPVGDKLGAIRWFAEPFDLDDMLAAVEEILGNG